MQSDQRQQALANQQAPHNKGTLILEDFDYDIP